MKKTNFIVYLITNKKILITGGAGFIGSNLCDYLIEKNNTIVCLDNFSTGKRENIAHLKEHKNFTLIEGDIQFHSKTLHKKWNTF